MNRGKVKYLPTQISKTLNIYAPKTTPTTI